MRGLQAMWQSIRKASEVRQRRAQDLGRVIPRLLGRPRRVHHPREDQQLTRQAWALLPAVHISKVGQLSPTGAGTLQEDLDRMEGRTGVTEMETEVKREVSVDRHPLGHRPMEDRLVEVVLVMGTSQDQVGLAAAMMCCCRS